MSRSEEVYGVPSSFNLINLKKSTRRYRLVPGTGKKTPGGAGTHTGHADAQRHTDRTDEPSKPTNNTQPARQRDPGTLYKRIEQEERSCTRGSNKRRGAAATGIAAQRRGECTVKLVRRRVTGTCSYGFSKVAKNRVLPVLYRLPVSITGTGKRVCSREERSAPARAAPPLLAPWARRRAVANPPHGIPLRHHRPGRSRRIGRAAYPTTG